MIKFAKLFTMLFALCVFFGMPLAAQAEYPSKPIILVSPFGIGGDSDLSARIWAKFAKEELGQSVVVVNKTGAGGLTGTLFASKANPDGYTLFLGQAGPCIMVPLISSTGNLSLDSFDYITRFILSNSAVVVSKNAKWNSLKEFQEDAQKNPGKFVFADPSPTSWLALAFRSWMVQNKVSSRISAYNSGAESATSLLGGYSDISFLFPPNYESLVESNKLKILAIGAKSNKYPNVQTFAEQGYAGNYYGWSGIVVPKGVPDEIKQKLIAVSEKIAKDPDFIRTVESLGFQADATSGEEWKKQVRAQYDEMQITLKALGIITK